MTERILIVDDSSLARRRARVILESGGYDVIEMLPAAKSALKPGKNTLAVHCHQTTGGQYIDVGLAVIKD